MSSSLHEKLIASAAANERSLSEEIEHILEQSFTEQARLEERFGGYSNLYLLTTIASAWKLIEHMTETKWIDNEDTLKAIKSATDNVFAMLKAKDADAKQKLFANELEGLGENWYRNKIIENLGVSTACYAVSIAKQMDVSDKIRDAIVSSSLNYKDLDAKPQVVNDEDKPTSGS